MGSLTKGIIGKEDLSIQTNTAAAETFNRLASAGSTVSLTKFPDMWDGTGKLKPAVSITRNYLSYYASLSAAVAGVNALNEKTLFLDNGGATVGANLDLSAYTDVQFVFLGGSKLSPSTGITLTLPSPSNIIAPPNQQIFSGDGTIEFSTGGTVYPDWWGVDGTADDVQINLANAAFPVAGGLIKLLAKTYTMATSIILSDYVSIVGSGQYQTIIDYTGTGGYLKLGNYSNISDLTLNLTGTTTGTGVYVEGTALSKKHGCSISRLYIHDAGYHGIALSYAYDITISDCVITDSGHRNINVSYSNDIEMSDLVLRDGGLANIIIAHDCFRMNLTNVHSIVTTDVTGGSGIWLAHTTRYINLTNCIAQGSIRYGFLLQADVHNCNFNNCISYDNTLSGFCLYPLESDDTPGSGDIGTITINNCQFFSNAEDGIDIINTVGYDVKNIIITNTIIVGNTLFGIDANDTSSTNLVLDGCIFSTNGSGDIDDSTTNGFVYGRNTGWVTQNFGVTAAIATGTAVNHSLDVTPTSVTVTAAESGPTDIYVTEVGATSFKINFGAGGNKTFYWYART